MSSEVRISTVLAGAAGASIRGMDPAAIDVSGLVKTFGSFRALDGLGLQVATGEVHGFLGPNGAGKSTTIRVLLGLLRADSGAVRLLGGDPWHDAVALHRRLAYVPGDVNLWPTLSGGEAIDLLGRLRGGLDPAKRAELLERFELDPTKKGRAYSKGNRQKVALVAALASDAELLVLDEPTSGLDPLKEAVFQACIGRRARRADGAALEPHPGRGRGAVRPGDDHPRRADRRDRDAVGAAPPDPHRDQRRDGAGAGRPRPSFPASTTSRRGPPRPLRRRHRPPRRGDPRSSPPRRAQPDRHAADARGAVPAPLRRRDRDERAGRRRRAAAVRAPPRAGPDPGLPAAFTILVADTAAQSESMFPTPRRGRTTSRP